MSGLASARLKTSERRGCARLEGRRIGYTLFFSRVSRIPRSALRAVGAARNDAFLSAPCRACPQTVQRKRDSNHNQPQRAPPQRVAQSHARSLLSARLRACPLPHHFISAQTLSSLHVTTDRAATGVRRSETDTALPRQPGALNAVLQRASISTGAHGWYAHVS